MEGENKGLIINGKTIEKISGPITFTLLVPKYECKEIKQFNECGIHPPIVILFGDSHFSRSNLCKNCKEENKCYNIWGVKFLKLLDDLAKVNKLDFNLEYPFLKNKKDEKTKPNKSIFTTSILEATPIGKINKFYENCSINKECTFKNIRWNYVDLRLGKSDSEYNYEVCLFSSVDDIINSVKFLCDNYTTFHLVEILISDDNLNKLRNNLQNLEIFVDILVHGDFKFFFISKKIETSLIYKQIKKFLHPLNNVDFWIEKINKLLLKIKDEDEEDNDCLVILNDLKTVLSSIIITEKLGNSEKEKLKNLFDEKITEYMKKNYEKIQLFFTKYMAILLDIYYILRSLKLPMNAKKSEYEENSIVSFGYFGYKHTTNISYFLKDILKIYEVKSYIDIGKKNEEEEDEEDEDECDDTIKKIIKHFPQVSLIDDDMIRCLNFTSQYINLDDEIKKHNENRVTRKRRRIDVDKKTQLQSKRLKTADGRRKKRNKRKSKKRSNRKSKKLSKRKSKKRSK